MTEPDGVAAFDRDARGATRMATAGLRLRRAAGFTPRADASPYLNRRPPVTALGPTVGVAVLVFTMAGLLWVRQANSVTEAGRDIARLLARREALLMQRAAARVALAQATDPVQLEVRARSLGFVPVDEDALEVVVVVTDGAASLTGTGTEPGSAGDATTGATAGAATGWAPDAMAAPGRRSPLELVVPPAEIPAAAEPSLSDLPLSVWQALEDGP